LSSEFKHIVRIAGRDLRGEKKLVSALSDLKGVGPNLACSLINVLRLDGKYRLGFLTDRQISDIEESLLDLPKLGVPNWALNRRKDIVTGSNLHIIGPDLDYLIKNDVEREKNTGSWRGIRHSLGLTVRGQHTRTTGRKGRTIGVRKAALRATAAASAKTEEKK
jgi:small subunit ribosomal protein S13